MGYRPLPEECLTSGERVKRCQKCFFPRQETRDGSRSIRVAYTAVQFDSDLHLVRHSFRLLHGVESLIARGLKTFTHAPWRGLDCE